MCFAQLGDRDELHPPHTFGCVVCEHGASGAGAGVSGVHAPVLWFGAKQIIMSVCLILDEVTRGPTSSCNNAVPTCGLKPLGFSKNNILDDDYFSVPVDSRHCASYGFNFVDFLNTD